MAIWSKLLRSGEGKKTRALESLIPEINALEPEIQKLSDDALSAKTGEFRQRLATYGWRGMCRRSPNRPGPIQTAK